MSSAAAAVIVSRHMPIMMQQIPVSTFYLNVLFDYLSEQQQLPISATIHVLQSRIGSSKRRPIVVEIDPLAGENIRWDSGFLCTLPYPRPEKSKKNEENTVKYAERDTNFPLLPPVGLWGACGGRGGPATADND